MEAKEIYDLLVEQIGEGGMGVVYADSRHQRQEDEGEHVYPKIRLVENWFEEFRAREQ